MIAGQVDLDVAGRWAVFVSEQDTARGRLFEPSNEAQQGGLSRTGGAEQGDQFT
jgi:hypothetical protein